MRGARRGYLGDWYKMTMTAVGQLGVTGRDWEEFVVEQHGQLWPGDDVSMAGVLVVYCFSFGG